MVKQCLNPFPRFTQPSNRSSFPQRPHPSLPCWAPFPDATGQDWYIYRTCIGGENKGNVDWFNGNLTSEKMMRVFLSISQDFPASSPFNQFGDRLVCWGTGARKPWFAKGQNHSERIPFIQVWYLGTSLQEVAWYDVNFLENGEKQGLKSKMNIFLFSFHNPKPGLQLHVRLGSRWSGTLRFSL